MQSSAWHLPRARIPSLGGTMAKLDFGITHGVAVLTLDAAGLFEAA
jgi:hypothetical protein